jgi:hypothetical protein
MKIAELCKKIKLSLLTILTIITLGESQMAIAEQQMHNGSIADPVPKYKIGDWWIIETRFVEDMSEVEHGPEKLGVQIYSHKYEVIGEDTLNGEATWIIEIKAYDIPRETKNDHGDHFLWQLYLNKANFTLTRLNIATRSGRFLVSGSKIKRDSFDFKENKPISIQLPKLTPLDFPRLPSGGDFPRYLSEDEKEFHFVDDWSRQNFVQYIVAIEGNLNGKRTNNLYVTLYNPSLGVITQKWVPGLPWWQEWRYATTERFIQGMWYAKLINWGSMTK